MSVQLMCLQLQEHLNGCVGTLQKFHTSILDGSATSSNIWMALILSEDNILLETFCCSRCFGFQKPVGQCSSLAPIVQFSGYAGRYVSFLCIYGCIVISLHLKTAVFVYRNQMNVLFILTSTCCFGGKFQSYFCGCKYFFVFIIFAFSSFMPA